MDATSAKPMNTDCRESVVPVPVIESRSLGQILASSVASVLAVKESQP